MLKMSHFNKVTLYGLYQVLSVTATVRVRFIMSSHVGDAKEYKENTPEKKSIKKKCKALGRDGFEDIEPIRRGRTNHSGNLRMPVNLLDMLLALMNKQQLRRNDDALAVFIEFSSGSLFLISLDGQVPEGDRVVGGSGGEDGGVCWVPFDGRDGLVVP